MPDGVGTTKVWMRSSREHIVTDFSDDDHARLLKAFGIATAQSAGIFELTVRGAPVVVRLSEIESIERL